MELKITVLILGQKIKLLGRKMKVSGPKIIFFWDKKKLGMGQIINFGIILTPVLRVTQLIKTLPADYAVLNHY